MEPAQGAQPEYCDVPERSMNADTTQRKVTHVSSDNTGMFGEGTHVPRDFPQQFGGSAYLSRDFPKQFGESAHLSRDFPKQFGEGAYVPCDFPNQSGGVRHVLSDSQITSDVSKENIQATAHAIESAQGLHGLPYVTRSGRTVKLTERAAEHLLYASRARSTKSQPPLASGGKQSGASSKTSRKSAKLRQKELEVELSFLEQDEILKQQEDAIERQKIERQRRKLEAERDLRKAQVMVEESDDGEPTDSSASATEASSQRVIEYVQQQDPTYGAVEDERQEAASVHTQIGDSVQASTAPPAVMPAQPNGANSVQPDHAQPRNVKQDTRATGTEFKACPNPVANPSTYPWERTTGYVPPAQPHDFGVNQLAQALQQQMYMSRLPPPEPTVFTGDAIEFQGWLTSFELLIESRQVTAAEKLYYLRKYVGGPARECIEGFSVLATNDAYFQAKKVLKERYGDSFIIATEFRRKLKSWPAIAKNDSKGLLRLADFLQQCETAMISNPYLSVLNDCMENQNILKKLPEQLVQRWGRQIADWNDQHQAFPSFTEFCKFVSKEARIANNPVTSFHALDMSSQKKGKQEEYEKQKRHVAATSTETQRKETNKKQQNGKQVDGKKEEAKQGPSCPLCSSSHPLSQCEAFLKKTLSERRDYVKEKRLCYGCLKRYHQSKHCKRRLKCEKCSKRHPTALHDDEWVPKERQEDTQTKGKDGTDTEKASVAKTATGQQRSTSSIIPVYVSSSENPSKERLVYAMLDTQSDASFITDDTCDYLGVDGPSTRLVLSTMAAEELVQTRKVSNLMVRGYYSKQKLEITQAYTRPTVPGNIEHVPTRETASQWPHLECIKNQLPPILDAEFGLLIGYNCSQALTPREVVASKSDPKEPFAQRTDLGWSVVGVSSADVTRSHCYRTAHFETSGNATIVEKMKVKEVIKPADFLPNAHDFEDYPDEQKQSYNDYKFMRQLEGGIHMRDGHYEMPLPFKVEDTRLPDNQTMALKRLESLKQRLKKQDQYRKDYEEFMKGIIDRGDCEEVTTDKAKPGKKWYIPHHGVYHPKKPGKIRVVFDCSASYKNTSLNEALLQGPDMINNLTGILYRFRKEPIAICCDVEKMFHQFKVNEEHRDFLRFFWWKDGRYDKPPQEFRMTVHLFGAVSSPGCANFGLRQAADDGEKKYGRKAADFVRNDFYVDDGITSVCSAEEGTQLVEATRQLCESKGLRLHKFVSNSAEVLQSLPLEECALEAKSWTLDYPQTPTVERTLGLEWCVQNDNFQFKISFRNRPATRRGIMSAVYSLYDPLGLLSPVVLVGRQILQVICRGKHDWDSPLPESIINRWERWRTSLKGLETLRIDRCYKPTDFGDVSSVELHHFSDASEDGYGQCSYVRFTNKTGRVHCSLVTAKAKVTPLKHITIPRLELSAAVLSVKTSATLRRQLHFENLQETFWSDSKVTLGYINNDARRFHTFVANRIQQIRNQTTPQQWNYIKTEENPADHVSRGLTVDALQKTSAWFNGPDFLWSSALPISKGEYESEIDVKDPEVKKALTTNAKEGKTAFNLKRFEKFSSWSSLIRGVAMCLKLKKILLCKARGTRVEMKGSTVSDLCNAEAEIIRLVQKDAFSEAMKLFSTRDNKRTSHRQLKRSNPLYDLDPFVDRRGILRVGGRIKAASLADEVKHPAVIPRSCHVAVLIARHCHEKVQHQGRGFTMNCVRMSGYHIIGGRRLIASLIDKCVQCRRQRGVMLTQKMADLPTDRVEPSPPFSYCAVDIFGPFYIKERRSELKRYGALFTCMASRAIHIETTNSMEADAFINALRRLIAIRGPLRQLRSDLGTNFVGAKNEFQQGLNLLEKQSVKSFLLNNKCDIIEFKFNVASASHMGGVWERQIRTVRNVLAPMLRSTSQQLDDELLRTFLCEVMAIVNSRPLTTDNIDDPNSLEPLTPNHLLHGKSQVVLPPPGEFQRNDLYVRRRWRRVQYLADQFWQRWRAEHLQTLQTRQKWTKEEPAVKEGDVVIIKDDNAPRNKWPLARIETADCSGDGRVRKVTLRVANRQMDNSGKMKAPPSFLERPVQKLVLLHSDQGTTPPRSQNIST